MLGSDREVLRHLTAYLSPADRSVFFNTLDRSETEGLHDAAHTQFTRLRERRRRGDSGVPVHAAACSLDSCGILVVGHSGFGKSTLVTALSVHSRARIVSDDTVWITNAVARDIAAPIAVRRTSPFWEQASALWYADAESERLMVLPEDLGAPALVPAVDVTHVILPRFGTTESRTIGPAEGYCHLVTGLRRPCTTAEYLEMAALMAASAVAIVGYRDIEESLRGVQLVIDERPRRHSAPTLLQPPDLDKASILDDVVSIKFESEVVFVRPSTGRIAWIRNWPDGTLPQPVLAELNSLGLNHVA